MRGERGGCAHAVRVKGGEAYLRGTGYELASASQVREINEMKLLIKHIDRNGRRGDVQLPARPAVVTPDMEPKIREAVE